MGDMRKTAEDRLSTWSTKSIANGNNNKARTTSTLENQYDYEAHRELRRVVVDKVLSHEDATYNFCPNSRNYGPTQDARKNTKGQATGVPNVIGKSVKLNNRRIEQCIDRPHNIGSSSDHKNIICYCCLYCSSDIGVVCQTFHEYCEQVLCSNSPQSSVVSDFHRGDNKITNYSCYYNKYFYCSSDEEEDPVDKGEDVPPQVIIDKLPEKVAVPLQTFSFHSLAPDSNRLKKIVPPSRFSSSSGVSMKTKWLNGDASNANKCNGDSALHIKDCSSKYCSHHHNNNCAINICAHPNLYENDYQSCDDDDDDEYGNDHDSRTQIHRSVLPPGELLDSVPLSYSYKFCVQGRQSILRPKSVSVKSVRSEIIEATNCEELSSVSLPADDPLLLTERHSFALIPD